MAHLIVIMGVSGTGKTTVGHLLSARLNLPFYDADDFHPKTNVAKMRQGIPLTDQDREPWLQLLAEKLKAWSRDGAILACSALKESYRQTLGIKGSLPLHWVHLSGTMEVIRERMLARKGHFMPESLLQSQFDTLEPPKTAISVDIDQSPAALIQEIMDKLPQ